MAFIYQTKTIIAGMKSSLNLQLIRRVAYKTTIMIMMMNRKIFKKRSHQNSSHIDNTKVETLRINRVKKMMMLVVGQHVNQPILIQSAKQKQASYSIQ